MHKRCTIPVIGGGAVSRAEPHHKRQSLAGKVSRALASYARRRSTMTCSAGMSVGGVDSCTLVPPDMAIPQADFPSTSAPAELEAVAPPEIPGYSVAPEAATAPAGPVYRATRLSGDPVQIYWMSGLSVDRVDHRVIANDASQLAKILHPHLVRVLDYGTSAGTVFQVLEATAGPTLASLLTGWPRDPRESAETVAALADGLRVVHEKGIIHGDITPETIDLSIAGQPRLTKFSFCSNALSQCSDAQMLAYCAPEKLRDGALRTELTQDVYSLGAVLYQLLTGRPPFVAHTRRELTALATGREPMSPELLVPGVPRGLCRIVQKCLSRRPDRRYESAPLLADDLRRFLTGIRLEARGPGLLSRCLKTIARHPVSTLAPTAALIGLGWWGWQGWSRLEALQPDHEHLTRVHEQTRNALSGAERNLSRSLLKMIKSFQLLGSEKIEHLPEMDHARDRVAHDLAAFNADMKERLATSGGGAVATGLVQLHTAELERLYGKLEDAEDSYHDALQRLNMERQFSPEGRDNQEINDALLICNRGYAMTLLAANRADEAEFWLDLVVAAHVGARNAGATDALSTASYARALGDRALGNNQLKRYDKSINDLTAALTLLEGVDPAESASSDLIALRQRLHRLRGLTYEHLGRADAAAADFQQCLDIAARSEGNRAADPERRPRIADVRAHLGHSLLEQGRTDQGREVLRQALEELRSLSTEFPQVWKFHALLADVYRDLGQTDSAETAAAKARELAPPEPAKPRSKQERASGRNR